MSAVLTFTSMPVHIPDLDGQADEVGCGASFNGDHGLKLSRFLNSIVIASFTLLALLGLS